MPTGVAIRDVRAQLFDAAERVLRRDGPSGLTSRAVTAEAGVAKGVLHRHFDDFDAFPPSSCSTASTGWPPRPPRYARPPEPAPS